MMWNALDALMCFGWVAVYVLVVISTCKEQYPAISPMFPLFNLPWEIAAVLNDMAFGSFSYASIAHIGWTLGNLAIACTILFKLHWYDFKGIVLYFVTLAFFIALNCSLVFRIDNGQLFTSFFTQ